MDKKEKIKSNFINKRKKSLKFKILLFFLILIGIILILIISLFFSGYFMSSDKNLKLGANIKDVKLTENGKIMNLELEGGSNEDISKIKFIFQDDEGEYYYETDKGISEINKPIDSGFFNWFFKNYKGEYNYQINSNDAGLKDFNKIKEIKIIFIYLDDEGEKETPVLDINKLPTTSSSSGGSGGGGGSSGGGDSGTTTQPIDPITPSLLIVNPINNTNSSDSGLDIEYTYGDASNCWYSNDSYSANTTLVDCVNITSVTWVDGKHNVTIWINDSSNNINSLRVSFTIDTIAPYFTNLANQSLYDNESLSYDINADDSREFGSFAINWTDTFSINSNGVLTNISRLSVRDYLINITINDSVNNLNSSIIKIQVNASDLIEDSCSNGIEDGDETGIDCGGDCDFECPTNWKSGISMLFNGTPGEDYVEEYFYYDKIVDDHKVVYINEDTNLFFEHNSRNLIQTEDGDGRFIYDIGVNGEDGIPNSGDEGYIRYRVDMDLMYKYAWTEGNTLGREAYPLYVGEFSFNDLNYTPEDSEISVVGTTGPIPDVDITNRDEYYVRGILDEFNDEWHSITFADDDDWHGVGGNQPDASDGKSILFVVNPKTPAIMFNNLTSDAQYYTTPPKAYWNPKILNQTTYVTGDIEIKLINIFNDDNIYYKIDDNEYQLYSSSLNSNSLEDGEHIIEYYYDDNYHKKRKIVKNPSYPSDSEEHGYLLIENEDKLKEIREKVTSTETDREPYVTAYQNLNGSIGHSFSNNYLWKGLRFGYQSFYEGEEYNAEKMPFALNNALIAVISHLNSSDDFDETGELYAYHSKRFVLDNPYMMDPIDMHDMALPVPCGEILYRGYYDIDVVLSTLFSYDLLISRFKSTDYENGITPIEDYKIRDTLAKSAFEAMQIAGGYGEYYDEEDWAGMWGSARQVAGLLIALGLSEYHTSYYGTSGFGSFSTAYPDTPFPDYPKTWKFVFYNNTRELNDTALDIPGFPNQNAEFGITGDPMVTYGEEARRDADNALNCDIQTVPAGSFKDRISYYDYHLMGNVFYILSNVMKSNLNFSYTNLELAYAQASVDPGLYGAKITGLWETDCPPQKFYQVNLINHFFPDIAQDIYDYLVSENDLEDEIKNRKPYSIIFYEDNWEELALGNPVARFSANPMYGSSSLSVSFDASDSWDIDGSISNYEWDFNNSLEGDGETDSTIYNENGVYTINLTITDDDGKKDSITKSIVVNDFKENLIFYAPFENTGNDYLNYGNSGTWINNENYSSGISGNAGYFDGNSYVDYGYNSTHEGMDELTLIAWVKPEKLDSGGEYNIISKENSAYRIRLLGQTGDATGKIWFYLRNESDESLSYIYSNTIPLDEWRHIALTYNGTKIKLYLNGTQIYSRTWSGKIYTPQQDLYIGSFSGEDSELFNGSIDEVMIYDRALSEDEISDIYEGGDLGGSSFLGSLSLFSRIKQLLGFSILDVAKKSILLQGWDLSEISYNDVDSVLDFFNKKIEFEFNKNISLGLN